jgi:hypothetical protein
MPLQADHDRVWDAMQADFERWYAVMLQQQGDSPATVTVPPSPIAAEMPSCAGSGETQEVGMQRKHVSGSLPSFSKKLDMVQSHRPMELDASLSDLRSVGTVRVQNSRTVAAEGSQTSCSGGKVPHVPTVVGDSSMCASIVDSTNVVVPATYPKEVLEAAAPLLTGDAAADADILGFYAARHKIVGVVHNS